MKNHINTKIMLLVASLVLLSACSNNIAPAPNSSQEQSPQQEQSSQQAPETEQDTPKDTSEDSEIEWVDTMVQEIYEQQLNKNPDEAIMVNELNQFTEIIWFCETMGITSIEDIGHFAKCQGSCPKS